MSLLLGPLFLMSEVQGALFLMSEVQGLLKIKDTHRPQEGPMPLARYRPTVGPEGGECPYFRVTPASSCRSTAVRMPSLGPC